MFVYGGNTNVPGGWVQAWAILSGVHLDMFIDYHIDNPATASQAFSSDWIKGTFYHELSHASQYVQAGSSWYNNFVNAELDEQYKYPSGQYNPYGTGGSSNSPIIALGEAWAYHMGFYLANQKYNVENSLKGDAEAFVQPALSDYSNIGNDGFSLENFTPALPNDGFKWIPKGLMLDLMDNTLEPTRTKVNDLVSGYTIQQIFAALQSDVSTIAQFKARLLQQNPNNPTNNQINNLFASYGY
ncbi:MAG: hypothetical protein JST47_09455 [Bacteroidetes bacterium]|nr:hypothetical protein [Bacteroidota bacterium]